MVIKPMIRSNICINAHPVGCAKETERQIEYVRSQKVKRGIKTAAEGGKGPKTVLVLGCSTGYGLGSRIAAAFEYGAATIGVSFEHEPPAATAVLRAGTTTRNLTRKPQRQVSRALRSMLTHSAMSAARP